MIAKNDGPHGIGGWLALLIILMVVLTPLLNFLLSYGAFAALENTYPSLVYAAQWSSYKTAHWGGALVFSTIGIFGGLGLATKRTPDAVSRAKITLWLMYPIAAISSVIIFVMMRPGLSISMTNVAGSVLNTFIMMAIWITYLNRSKRVRNTYGLNKVAPIVKEISVGYPHSNETIANYSKTASPKIHSVSPSQTIIDEDRFYAEIAEELETGNTNKGLWTRLFVECGGDENQIKVLYIRQRVEQLVTAEVLRLDSLERERAAEAERLEALKRQLGDSADPELIAAVWDGNWAIAKKLLSHGIKPNGRNPDGHTLLELAKRRGDKLMIQLLESYGAP